MSLTRSLLLAVATAALLAPAAARADETPFEMQGDSASNVFIINISNDTIELCVDSFCSPEAATTFQTINVNGFDGNDTLIINQFQFLTNGRGGITISFNGGVGNDSVAICPEGCPDSGIQSTTYAPGAAPGQGTVTQTNGVDPLRIVMESANDVTDRSPGALTTEGTPDDDVVTYGAGAQAGDGRIAIGSLPPYEFANKPTLTVNGNEGADRLESDGPGTPTGLGGDCGNGRPVCFEGGSSVGDTLVVHGVPAALDEATLEPHGRGIMGQEIGAIGGIAGTGDIRFGGVDAIELVLQYGADGDTFAIAGGVGDDRFELTPAQTPRRVEIAAVLDQAAPGSLSLPPIGVSSANDSDVASVDIDATDGDDELVLQGTARDDGLSLKPAGTGDELRHSIDGRLVYVFGLTGFERYAGEGADGADLLRVRGDVVPATGWGGGNGSDTLALDGTGSSRVAVALGDGSVRQDGFAGVVATGTEIFDAGAGGNSVDLTGDETRETLRYMPAATDSGTVVRDADGRTVKVRGVNGLLRLDALGGSDSVVVRGGAAADEIPLTRDESSDTLTAQVGTTLPVRLAATTEAARIEGAEGQDRFIVAGRGGPASVTVHGGGGVGGPESDTLVMTVGVKDATVTYGTDPASGLVETAAPPVGFEALEHVQVEGDGTGTLTVNGSAAADALTQAGNGVTAGAGAAVSFSRFPALALDARAGGDQLTLAPRGTSGVDRIAVAGGESSSDLLAVNGTELSDEIRYAPTAPDAGRVEIAGAPPVTFAATEALTLDGRTTVPAGDALIVDTRALDGTQVLDPGASFDAGTIRFRDGAGSTTTGAPVNFARLGSGSVALDGDGRDDTLHYRGSAAGDVFDLDGDGSVRLNSQVPVTTSGIHTLVLQSLDGEDTFNVPAAHPFPGVSDGPGIIAEGGNPSAGDVVNVSGGSARMTTDFARSTVQAEGSAAAKLAGVESLNLDGASDLAVLGGAEPDVVRYTPTGAQAGSVSVDGNAIELRFSGVAGDLTSDPGGGSDQVVVSGRTSDDANRIERGDPTVVRVESMKPVHVPAATESLQLLGRDGADTTTIAGNGGPSDLTVAGGLPTADGDRLVLQSPSAAVTYDVVPAAGMLESPGGPVNFLETERLDLQGDDSGSVTVRGTNGADSVSLGGQSTSQARVNGGASVEYRDYPAMVLDGRGGDDAFDVSYVTLGDLSTIQVVGAGGLGDRLDVVDQPGSPRTLQVRPTAPDAGVFSLGAPPAVLTFESTESLLVDGMGGDDELRLVTPAGAQRVQVAPGATDDAASLQLESLVPVSFQRLGAGRLRVADADGQREDTVVYDGGAGADAFNLIGDPNSVTLGTRVPVIPDSVKHLILNGLDGDDTYDLTGPLPFATTKTDASGPDRADTLTVRGPSGPVTADLGAGTLTGYGGTISYPGVEVMNTDSGGLGLTQVGSAADDALCYDPMSPRSGRAYIVGGPGGGSVANMCAADQRGTNILHTFTDTSKLVLDPGDGADQVIVNGTANADLATIRMTYPNTVATLHPNAKDPLTFRLPAEVPVASTENLAFAADNGSDIIDVTAYNNAAPVVFLDGEDPSTKRFGDELRVRDGAGRAMLQNVTSHTFGDGTVFADYRGGSQQRIDYAKIEQVTLFKDPKVG